MPLTDTAVRQAKAAEKEYSMTDASGLSLFVAPNGTKSWHFRFSWHGKQPRMSLGTYPEITLKEAREQRDQARALVAKGIDPRLQRRKERRAAADSSVKTFEVVANEWYAFKLPRWAKSKRGAANQAQLYLDKDLVPSLGKIPIAEVTRSEVLATLRIIERRGALNVARKCRTWLNEIFRFGIASGYLEMNPASDLDIVAAKEPPEKHNPMLRQHELKAFLTALREADLKDYTRSAVRLLLLTGVRTIELRSATIDQFDFDGALWTVPAGTVKQLKKVIRVKGEGVVPPYLVPLSRQAVEEARKVHQMTGRYKLLIAGRHEPTKPISDGTVNMALRRMGYEGRLTGHGIRATISTALNEMGYNEDWIEAQLSHAGSSKVRKTYNHAEYVEQRRGMMQDWADYLDSLESEA
ncbi:integrase arm-type DNA-binding domain-containing protein [Pseudomonas sp. AO-1]|uniref:tyrosine-type recombinase/integrase n=1 Tax=Pseudomonas sp. AO-1 TaxID=2855434 RepID=UPI001C74AC56|nr:integrase arm-type DNA-binding domain-containing protein [Pseudomonas sp. AO-1]QXZ11710.1 integrase arm-type DNA-binding domain-containing protein [Pseudomonas sp. AO-1]